MSEQRPDLQTAVRFRELGALRSLTVKAADRVIHVEGAGFSKLVRLSRIAGAQGGLSILAPRPTGANSSQWTPTPGGRVCAYDRWNAGNALIIPSKPSPDTATPVFLNSL